MVLRRTTCDLNESGVSRGSEEKGLHVTGPGRRQPGRVQRGNIPGGHQHLYRIKSDELPSGRTRETEPQPDLTCTRARAWSLTDTSRADRVPGSNRNVLRILDANDMILLMCPEAYKYYDTLLCPPGYPPPAPDHLPAVLGLTLRLSRTTKPRRTSAYMHTDARATWIYINMLIRCRQL